MTGTSRVYRSGTRTGEPESGRISRVRSRQGLPLLSIASLLKVYHTVAPGICMTSESGGIEAVTGLSATGPVSGFREAASSAPPQPVLQTRHITGIARQILREVG